MTPDIDDFAPLPQLTVHYQVYNDDADGVPLVLLHGGAQTIEGCFGGLLPLLPGRRLIAVEMQGHGRTPDAEREPSLRALADDVIGVLDHLRVPQVDVLGYSLGGLVTLQLATHHAERLHRILVVSAHTRIDGFHPDVDDPEREAASPRGLTPATMARIVDEYQQVAPAGANLDTALSRYMPLLSTEEHWNTDTLTGITTPTLVMIGDHDVISVEHAEYIHSTIPGAQLAVVPGSTHELLYDALDVVAPNVHRFLDR